MSRNMSFIAASAAMVLVSSAAVAADQPSGHTAELFDKVVRCRSQADPAKRLACYDRSVDAMDSAAKKHEIVVVDQAQIRKAQRSVFGLNAPDLTDLTDQKGTEKLDRIDAVVRSVTLDRDNRLIFTLEDGAQWHQIDDRPSFFAHSGSKVAIRTASFGSYFADFQGGGGMRVRRDR